MERLPDQWVQKLFTKLEVLYGASKMKVMWGNVSGPDLFDAWAEALAGFEGQHIKAALEVCLLSYVEFPPTLPQFVRLCKDARDRERSAIPRLDSPPRSREAMPPELIAMIHRLTDPNRKKDCRDWARQILVLADKGEYHSSYGIRLAKEALGLVAESPL